MTITKISQVVGIRLNFASIADIFNLRLLEKEQKFQKKYKNNYLTHFADYLKDLETKYKENFIDKTYEFKLYELTHDIYEIHKKEEYRKELPKDELGLTNLRFVIGIEITDTSTEEGYVEEESYIVSLNKINNAFKKVKEWATEKGVVQKPFMYTIHNDCICCN
jgi:hypothetical protein